MDLQQRRKRINLLIARLVARRAQLPPGRGEGSWKWAGWDRSCGAGAFIHARACYRQCPFRTRKRNGHKSFSDPSSFDRRGAIARSRGRPRRGRLAQEAALSRRVSRDACQRLFDSCIGEIVPDFRTSSTGLGQAQTTSQRHSLGNTDGSTRLSEITFRSRKSYL